MKNNIQKTPTLLIVAIIIPIIIELYSSYLGGFNLIRLILTGVLLYFTFIGSNIAKRIFITLLIIGTGYAFYPIPASGYNAQTLIVALSFIVVIALLTLPKDVRTYFEKST